MNYERENIEFPGVDNVLLRGWFYKPVSNPKSAVIIMTHGYTALKEMGLDEYARKFCLEGHFYVLFYDNRTFGSSEGEPRSDINPYKQIEDYSSAIDYIEKRFDHPVSIGLWGVSYSGGHVFVVGSREKHRIKCIVSQVPTISGKKNTTRRPLWQKILEEDKDCLFENTEYIPVVDPEKENRDVTNSFSEFFLKKCSALPWMNQMTRRSVHFYSQYEPWESLKDLSSIPLLLIITKNDTITSTEDQLEAYEKEILEPKRLVLLDGGHFSIYGDDQPAFHRAANEALEWFQKYLN